jgi:hypothetical protein
MMGAVYWMAGLLTLLVAPLTHGLQRSANRFSRSGHDMEPLFTLMELSNGSGTVQLKAFVSQPCKYN